MSSGKTEKIYGINGPVIYLKGKTDFKMSEMVHVGEEKLVGEVISLDKDRTTVQVYEETSGLHPGELVEGTGAAVSVTLAPGIISLTVLRDRWSGSLTRAGHLSPVVSVWTHWTVRNSGRRISQWLKAIW